MLHAGRHGAFARARLEAAQLRPRRRPARSPHPAARGSPRRLVRPARVRTPARCTPTPRGSPVPVPACSPRASAPWCPPRSGRAPGPRPESSRLHDRRRHRRREGLSCGGRVAAAPDGKDPGSGRRPPPNATTPDAVDSARQVVIVNGCALRTALLRDLPRAAHGWDTNRLPGRPRGSTAALLTPQITVPILFGDLTATAVVDPPNSTPSPAGRSPSPAADPITSGGAAPGSGRAGRRAGRPRLGGGDRPDRVARVLTQAGLPTIFGPSAPARCCGMMSR